MTAPATLFDALPRTGADDLVAAIVNEFARAVTPLSAFDVSRNVRAKHADRWLDATVRTRVSALEKNGQLRWVDSAGKHSGREVRRYVRCV